MRSRVLSAALLLSLTAATAAAGQETRYEVVKPTTPEDDARPNSPEVPDATATVVDFQRVLVLRFKHQADLLAGLEDLVRRHGVRNGVILSGVGSVRNYHVHSVSNRTFPSKNRFVKDPTAPADIVSINGYVIDGRVHAHLTLTNEDGAFGGHLEPETNVFTFAIVTLAELTDAADLSRFDDKTWR